MPWRLSFNPRTREGCDPGPSCTTGFLRVSIHAPARGATAAPSPDKMGDTCFNPRTREGCDNLRKPNAVFPASFNPRTREGCDITMFILRTPAAVFQSTHPRGVRRANRKGGNPRCKVSIHAPARGATTDVEAYVMPEGVSIHAPARGATLVKGGGVEMTRHVSIHAPARGATYCWVEEGQTITKFQSTHPRGVRQVTICI